jgi:P27 family predicted phage terminase small subunit
MVREHAVRFDAADAEILALYCETWATWVECKGMVDDKGVMCGDRLAPWFQGMERARTMMRSILTQFGMTPADRTRVRMPEGEKGSEGDGDFD